MERLRILHTESSLGWGGQEIRVLTEARALARRGHAMTIAAPAESRIFEATRRYGVEGVAIPIGRKSLGGLIEMRALLRDREFDVVNTHSSTDSWLAAVAAATLRHAPPLVRTRHISAPVPRNFATRWLYASATDRIVTTGEKLRLQVIAETGVPPERVVSIPTGIDLERFRTGDAHSARLAAGLPGEAFVVGIVATLRSWKGHRYLFEAFARREDKASRLVVVGDGPQREALEHLARELAIADRVVFAGNREDVAPWLRAFDVFCLPSYANEGVPQALMQAMATGLPVVTTPVGSIAEIVEDGVSGLLVRPESADALRDAIDALAADPVRRAALSRKARETALARFGEDRMADAMEDVFRAAARARRG
ncbi:MAG: glycosyltransferase family 4 protein [Betaproteobacteria bacterium]|nr:glycosyltransferase family 4 protein [Betaproteobacteria bacterium]